MGKDYYQILGLDRKASADQIKSSYKKLAKKYHPDVSKEDNAEERFKEIQEAYSILSDPQKKSSYDQFGSDFSKFGGGQGFGGFNFGGGAADFEDLFSGMSGFKDIFDIFGRRSHGGPRKGVDLQVRLNVSFQEAVFGTNKEIDIDRVEKCPECKGSGSAKDSSLETCSDCQGRGVKQTMRRTILGTFATQGVCQKCSGEGQIIKNPCKACKGQKFVRQRRAIKVKIPPGADTGISLRLSGEGNAGERGGMNGDLYVVLFVEPHDVFKRDGFDVFCEIPITFSEAALGTEIEVPTLRGKAKLKVPSGTQSNTVFRMDGQGIQELGGKNYGDQFVKVELATPKKLSKKQKEIFNQLAEMEEAAKNRKGFFEKIKDSFKS
jgi:molecular chaperone DnaJ